MARRIAPPALPDHPTIRVVCPSATLNAEQLERALEGAARLEAAGCRVRFDEAHARRCWRGYYAGDDATRLEAFVAACCEPGVDAVWWARGGGGAGRIAEAAVAALRTVAPRVVVGFSDATALLAALGTELGWITFHGPVLSSLARSNILESLQILRGEVRTVAFAPGQGPAVTGVLRGGNLMTLASLVGRSVCPPGRGTLWLLEEVDEADRRVDRAVEQLRAAGLFHGARGVWVGALYGVAQPERVAAECGLPVLTGAPADHVGPMSLLPLGARVTVDPEAGVVYGHHAWVRRG